MKLTLSQLVEYLEYSDLLYLKQELSQGGLGLKRILNEKIKSHQKEHAKECSTCTASLQPESTNNFTLLFGPHDFKKKSSFCGLDCLEYFLNELKTIRKVV